jgi:large subunit ribosomal protein L35
MPKMKTKRAAAKRFKFTASGRLKHRKAFRSHILGSKDRKRKRHLRGPGMVDATNERALRLLLPYA